MGNVKGPHHRGAHQRRSAAIRAAAYADPFTRCWRCKHTLAEIRSRKPKARWTAGHLPGYDGVPDAPMAAECSSCNYGHGAAMGNRRRGHNLPRAAPFRTSRRW